MAAGEVQGERTAGVYARLGAAFAALAAAAVAAVLVATLVRGLPAISSGTSSAPAPAGTATTTTSTPASAGASSSGFPSPPAGSVVLAQQAGSDPVALAVKPIGKKLLLQASLVQAFAKPPAPTGARFEVTDANGRTTTTAAAAPCGKGCWRATSAVTSPRRVAIVLDGYEPSRLAFALPARVAAEERLSDRLARERRRGSGCARS